MNTIKNVAIIMDGNGRWAKMKHRPRVWGHIRGSHKVHEIVTESVKMGLDSLTLYAFSTENWSRPSDEIKNLFKILKKFLVKEKKTLIKNNIQFGVIGNYKVLDSSIVEIIEDIKEATLQNTGMQLSLAINYGGRAEILDAVNSFLKNKHKDEITEEELSQHLYNPKVQNIDLLIRTAGDTRISNFLLWQLCYAELYFSQTKWPDFSIAEYKSIIDNVGNRERRYGSIETEASLEKSKEKALLNQKVIN